MQANAPVMLQVIGYIADDTMPLVGIPAGCYVGRGISLDLLSPVGPDLLPDIAKILFNQGFKPQLSMKKPMVKITGWCNI